MKYIISRYNHDISWIKDYTDDYVLYDRSEVPLAGSIIVPNMGSDIYDKFTYMIDNYDNLPDVAVYTKANLFKYITKEEFDEVKDNKSFTPLLSKNHEEKPGVSYYSPDGVYNEINNLWFVKKKTKKIDELVSFLGTGENSYMRFAPGSNYILPKENILKHPKEFYQKLNSFLEYDVYPPEAWIIERNLYEIWH